MNFEIIAHKNFQRQFDKLDLKSQYAIKEKTNLLKRNPYRFKALKSKKHKLFRIRLNLNKKEMRLIYKIIEPNIILICLLERKRNYKNLERYLKELNI